jgi:hypothetical protein
MARDDEHIEYLKSQQERYEKEIQERIQKLVNEKDEVHIASQVFGLDQAKNSLVYFTFRLAYERRQK